MAAPAAARSSYSFTPGRARVTMAVHGVLAKHAGFAHAVELFRAVDGKKFVQKALREDQFRFGQVLAQHVILIHRQVIAVPGIDLHQSDTPALEL